MTTTNFNLRGIKQEVMTMLKKQADQENTSVNSLMLQLVERGIGFSGETTKPTYHDLDHLAGTWSNKDAAEFEQNTAYFNQVDEDMWR